MAKKLFPLAAEMEYPAGTAPCSRCEEQVGARIIVFPCLTTNELTTSKAFFFFFVLRRNKKRENKCRLHSCLADDTVQYSTVQ